MSICEQILGDLNTASKFHKAFFKVPVRDVQADVFRVIIHTYITRNPSASTSLTSIFASSYWLIQSRLGLSKAQRSVKKPGHGLWFLEDDVRGKSALLNSNTILTAAHCFDPIPGGGGINYVRLGDHDITTTNDGASPTDVSIARSVRF